MARSSIETLMPLDQFAELMGFEAFQFNQISGGLTFAREAQCGTVVYQHQWQRQFFSLDEIALAISSAENALAPILNYFPAPKYFENEDTPYPTDYDNARNWLTPKLQWKPVQTAYQHIQALGTRTRTLIEADVVYTPSDDDNDGVNDHFTLTVNTTETNLSKLVLYFSVADREILDETWRIRPLRITATGTTATFKGHISLLVNPALKEVLAPAPLDATDVTIYVTTVDAYIVSYDTALIGTAYWDDAYYPCNCPSSGTINAATLIIKAPDGWIRPVLDGIFNCAPDRLQLNYLAGVAYDSTGRVREPFASMIAGLSVSYLPSGSCGCERADQKMNFLMSSPADGEQRRRPLSLKEIDNNQFQPTRGALYAWSMCQELRHPSSVTR